MSLKRLRQLKKAARIQQGVVSVGSGGALTWLRSRQDQNPLRKTRVGSIKVESRAVYLQYGEMGQVTWSRINPF